MSCACHPIRTGGNPSRSWHFRWIKVLLEPQGQRAWLQLYYWLLYFIIVCFFRSGCLSPQNDEYALSWKHSVRLKYHVHQLFSPVLVYAILQGDGELFNCDCGSLPRLSSQVCHSPLVPLGPHEMGHLPSDNQRHKVIFAICLQGCFSTVSNAQQLPVGVGVQAIWHRTFHGTQNPFAWGHAAAGVIRNLRPFSHNVWGHTMGFGDGCEQLHGRSLEWTVVLSDIPLQRHHAEIGQVVCMERCGWGATQWVPRTQAGPSLSL